MFGKMMIQCRENRLHRYYTACGAIMHGSDVKEEKIELIADADGVLKINRERLLTVNSFEQMMIASDTEIPW